MKVTQGVVDSHLQDVCINSIVPLGLHQYESELGDALLALDATWKLSIAVPLLNYY